MQVCPEGVATVAISTGSKRQPRRGIARVVLSDCFLRASLGECGRG